MDMDDIELWNLLKAIRYDYLNSPIFTSVLYTFAGRCSDPPIKYINPYLRQFEDHLTDDLLIVLLLFLYPKEDPELLIQLGFKFAQKVKITPQGPVAIAITEESDKQQIDVKKVLLAFKETCGPLPEEWKLTEDYRSLFLNILLAK
jgi:hypothetical protein